MAKERKSLEDVSEASKIAKRTLDSRYYAKKLDKLNQSIKSEKSSLLKNKLRSYRDRTVLASPVAIAGYIKNERDKRQRRLQRG